VSTVDGPRLLWRKSRACNPAQCVEVAFTRDRVFVRDSNDPSGPILELFQHEWRAFVRSVVQGDYAADDLAANRSLEARHYE
jgi:Domain of unknown function (DUF397)